MLGGSPEGLDPRPSAAKSDDRVDVVWIDVLDIVSKSETDRFSFV